MSKPFRPKLACKPCTRKKIKCNKLNPCDNCIKRGHPEICFRDLANSDETALDQNAIAGREPAVTEHGPPDAILQLMQNLVDRIEQIEARQQQAQVQDQQQGHAQNRQSREGPVSPAGYEVRLRENVSSDATAIDIVAAIDQQPPLQPGTLHALRSVLGGEHGFAQNEEHQRVFLQRFIPDFNCAQQLVQYHTESLLWSHGGYHTPTLMQELTRFYSEQNGQVSAARNNLQWVAFFFAILSGSVISASAPLAEKWGFQKEEQSLLSERWHDAAIECLHLSQYLTTHTLHTLQAIVVLNTSAYMLGRMESQNVLNATGIRIAQNMGLHKLGAEPDAFSEGLIYRETRRRVWYALLRQDYFFIPFSDAYHVRPAFNKTSPPRNCRDEEMAPLPEYMPTITSYCTFLDRIAGLMPEIHDAFNACSTIYARYEEVIRFDSKMRSLATVHRPYFFTDSPLDPAWPSYTLWARCSLTLSFAHKVIMIHRKMLARSMTDPIFSFTRKTCVAASKTILKTLRQPQCEQRPVMWTEQAFTVTAGVILCFDMLYRSPLDSESAQQQHRALVEEGIENLRAITQSCIAQKGVRLLTALLRENTGRTAASRNKRCFDEMEAGREPPAPFVDVEAFIRGFWKRLVESRRESHGQEGIYQPTPPPPLPGTAAISPFGSEDVGWAVDYGLYWPIQSMNVNANGNIGEGIGDALNSRNLYWPLPPLGQGDETMDALDTRNGLGENVPSFEDLLFSAENFDF
ncbi:transcriptional regulator family: Fungal Specific TF [Penicillium roqueforti]|nr:transcriptional regulator family: Fungal Specific TF [Penicillium roqueforti]KAI2750843.1 transcriptional regulator family: Fungal Specific TF [Penicillium roqueforti]KAI3248562.1 transcriptional regulator family: Fungal Specific TF [Penicillium roqueforti]